MLILMCYVCVCVCVQYLTPHSMMRGYLARDILSFEVADVLKEKAEHSGERSSFFASLALFWLCLLRVTGSLLALSLGLRGFPAATRQWRLH